MICLTNWPCLSQVEWAFQRHHQGLFVSEA